MILYACNRQNVRAEPPPSRWPPGRLLEGVVSRAAAVLHPCARAARALDAAGHAYELRTVAGYRASPWTWGSREADRAEVRRLSGGNEVPILVLDDGRVISGSGEIVRWAHEHHDSGST